MSSALRQSQRANIRESSGNGLAHGAEISALGRAGTSSASSIISRYCVDISPTQDDICEQFKAPAILKVKEKLAIAQGLLDNETIIGAKLKSLDLADRAAEFHVALPAELKGDRKKNDYLTKLLVKLASTILPAMFGRKQAIGDFELRVKHNLQNLKLAYDQAHAAASTKRANEFATKFIKLRGPDRDRKFLENGVLPQDEHKRFCLGCGHGGCVDEPNSNADAMRCWLIGSAA